MINFILWPIYGVLILWQLWIFFLAVMSLKRAKDAGILTFWNKVFGYPILFIGLIIDFVANVFVMSFLLYEIPKETTVTSRLKRHNKNSDGWRKSVAVWAEQFLNKFDPSGFHI